MSIPSRSRQVYAAWHLFSESSWKIHMQDRSCSYLVASPDEDADDVFYECQPQVFDPTAGDACGSDRIVNGSWIKTSDHLRMGTHLRASDRVARAAKGTIKSYKDMTKSLGTYEEAFWEKDDAETDTGVNWGYIEIEAQRLEGLSKPQTKEKHQKPSTDLYRDFPPDLLDVTGASTQPWTFFQSAELRRRSKEVIDMFENTHGARRESMEAEVGDHTSFPWSERSDYEDLSSYSLRNLAICNALECLNDLSDATRALGFDFVDHRIETKLRQIALSVLSKSEAVTDNGVSPLEVDPSHQGKQDCTEARIASVPGYITNEETIAPSDSTSSEASEDTLTTLTSTSETSIWLAEYGVEDGRSSFEESLPQIANEAVLAFEEAVRSLISSREALRNETLISWRDVIAAARRPFVGRFAVEKWQRAPREFEEKVMDVYKDGLATVKHCLLLDGNSSIQGNTLLDMETRLRLVRIALLTLEDRSCGPVFEGGRL